MRPLVSGWAFAALGGGGLTVKIRGDHRQIFFPFISRHEHSDTSWDNLIILQNYNCSLTCSLE